MTTKNNRLKLLQILYPGIGGHSSVAFSLIEGDRTREYIHTLMGYGIETPSIAFQNKSKELSTPSTSIKKEQGIDFKSLFQTYYAIKNKRPNIIIMHSTSVILIVWWYCLWNKASFISVEHQSNDVKSTKDWIYTFLIILFSEKIVYLTNQYAKEVKNKLKIFYPGKKVTIINNGINTLKFIPKPKSNNKVLVFSMIARMTKLRDHKTLIDAFTEVSHGKNYQLILVGDGDTKKELVTYTERKEVNQKITFTGNVDEKHVLKIIHETDIYIHSSLAETLSTSLLQVMACKVPIIATDIPGINNLLVDERDALLFPSKDANTLKLKIHRIIRDENLANNLVANAYEKVICNFSCNAMFEKYNQLMQQ